MSDQASNLFPNRGINKFVSNYVRNLPDLSGKTIVDIPCGDGRASGLFQAKGATVLALDLFPEFMRTSGITARFADMMGELPLENQTADYIICQEGIEHVPDQLKLLSEFNRVLKKGGTLLLTTPNLSHVRARLSYFFFETDFWRRMPPTELDSIWFCEEGTNRIYYGHLFLLGVHHMQTISSISGFVVKERVKTDLGYTSISLGILLYPVFVLMTFLTYAIYSRKKKDIPVGLRRKIWWEHVKVNLSPKTLFCKHIFWVLQKEIPLRGKGDKS